MTKTLKIKSLVSLLFFISYSSIAQVKISGKVFNTKDSTAVYGASVYLDGTSIGTSTNNSGNFSLALNRNIQANMIISSIGFEPIEIPDIFQYSGKTITIYIKEKKESLETVYLETDPWSREKKLKIFKQQFLGSDRSADNCKIMNEDDLNLRYKPSQNTLYASSENKLIIENTDLGYIINYNLVDFNVQFKTDGEENEWPVSVYYAGTSYFKDITKNIPKRILRKRKRAYLGSSLHFMRSLTTNSLEEQDFELFEGANEVAQDTVFKLDKSIKNIEVHPLIESVQVRYKHQHWSKIVFKADFLIDGYGNFSPTTALLFSGYISSTRISKMVPLNYQIDI